MDEVYFKWGGVGTTIFQEFVLTLELCLNCKFSPRWQFHNFRVSWSTWGIDLHTQSVLWIALVCCAYARAYTARVKTKFFRVWTLFEHIYGYMHLLILSLPPHFETLKSVCAL